MYTEPSAQADPREEHEGGSTPHRVQISERGSFAHASCDCGWFAPGRRSRDRARRDADEHLAAPEAA
ncbi:hypothetical protein [Kitasatospora sp. NBC_01266]|uniref:hypothetical protein n=1 Tax=Kitasatospora sp. NBC_01266 TaxID=2903572 RepID=UPI002E31BD6F|nr:hypothetical protein [Kitasatospora sp. NBC_01266]